VRSARDEFSRDGGGVGKRCASEDRSGLVPEGLGLLREATLLLVSLSSRFSSVDSKTQGKQVLGRGEVLVWLFPEKPEGTALLAEQFLEPQRNFFPGPEAGVSNTGLVTTPDPAALHCPAPVHHGTACSAALIHVLMPPQCF